MIAIRVFYKITVMESEISQCKMRISCKVQVPAMVNIGTVGRKCYMAYINHRSRCGTFSDHTYIQSF